jgi:DUF4097 and DUF4098 domain-containing protein YvlB
VVWAYCGGLKESDLVNVQEIALDHINTIEVSYRWENIVLLSGTTETLIIKEYMSRDKTEYYAAINNRGGTLTIERGKRPLGILFNTFNVRVEVYLPASYRNAITIRATSGKIEAPGELVCSHITIENASGGITVNALTAESVDLETTSGSIRCETVNGNVNFRTTSGSIAVNAVTAESARFKTTSGSIRCETVSGTIDLRTTSGSIAAGSIDGDVSAEATSGGITLNQVRGGLTAKTTSGSIRSTVAEGAGDIALTATSGGVTLNLPETFAFSFSSRTSSGSLNTPFADKLFSPVSDRHSAQGVVGNAAAARTIPAITIQTYSGSIRVRWID